MKEEKAIETISIFIFNRPYFFHPTNKLFGTQKIYYDGALADFPIKQPPTKDSLSQHLCEINKYVLQRKLISYSTLGVPPKGSKEVPGLFTTSSTRTTQDLMDHLSKMRHCIKKLWSYNIYGSVDLDEYVNDNLSPSQNSI